jgi:hypothetical protein
MKKYILFFLLFLTLFSCKSTNDINQTNQNEIIKFSYTVNPDESIKNNNEFYKVTYHYNFEINNSESKFFIDYCLFDENENMILKKEGISPKKNNSKKNSYTVEDKFFDSLSYSKIKYLIKIKSSGNTNVKQYIGEYFNNKIPGIAACNIGPVISKYIEKKANVSLRINLQLTNISGLSWIHFIPPGHDSFWEIPWQVTSDGGSADGMIYEKTNNFLHNGDYILQLNFDKFGIIQKEVKIIDIYNNQKGLNYGFPIANELDNDKKSIKLDVSMMEKIDFMELWIFEKINDNMQKIGIAKYLTPTNVISKNELSNLIKDDFNNKIKLKNNKEYFYQVYLYSKEFNSIKYIAISDIYSFKLYGFLFF